MENLNLDVVEGKLFSSGSSDYRAQKYLGCGVYGEVLQCRNLTSNKIVALKFIKDNEYMDEAKHEVQHLSLSMFHLYIALKLLVVLPNMSSISYIPQEKILKEMQALKSSKYNIVKWIDSFIYEGLYCLEMEKLDITLHEFVRKTPSKSLPLKKIRPILQQVCKKLNLRVLR